MTDPQSYRPPTGTIPTDPGVYRFIDPEGRVLYVGKAKNLRARLQNYFQDPSGLSPRINTMVHTACQVIWVVVGSEIEALTLEYSWIKEFQPRFNVVFRDNKSYPYVAISLTETYPRVWITRQEHKKTNKYFGPYTKVWAIRDTLDNLLTAFPMRSCSKGQFNQAQRAGRPCLFGYIGKCSAPCVGKISPREHRELVDKLIDFMDGDQSDVIAQRTRAMQEAALNEEFEKAARLRDEIKALNAIAQRNVVVFDSNLDADIIGLVADELEASLQIFSVRGGRIRAQKGWISEEAAGVSMGEMISELIVQVYGDPSYDKENVRRESSRSVDDRAHTAVGAIPAEIWVPVLPDDAEQLEEWLTMRRGRHVSLRHPRRGDKAQLALTVQENARQALERHKLQRAGDITVRSRALEELRDGLGLERSPLRIECFDISHLQGHQQVASMVVFEDGLAKKSDYRKFIIRGKDGNGGVDDTAAMDEVLRRRLARLLDGAHGSDAGGEEDELPAQKASASEAHAEPHSQEGEEKKRRFAYRPDLLVVDGGLPQVNAAQAVIDEMGADVQVVGLAKRLEEVWVPGEDFPIIFPRTSPALRLLQQLRDESHRFAITFHRKKRSAAMTRSSLDAIPGLGPAKQKALLKQFSSVAKIREASIEELTSVPGIGPTLAEVILSHLQPKKNDESAGE